MNEETYRKYRVSIRSKGGMYAQYNGYVDVFAASMGDAPDRALTELRRTSFPDRGRDCWIVEAVEQLPASRGTMS